MGLIEDMVDIRAALRHADSKTAGCAEDIDRMATRLTQFEKLVERAWGTQPEDRERSKILRDLHAMHHPQPAKPSAMEELKAAWEAWRTGHVVRGICSSCASLDDAIARVEKELEGKGA